MSLNLLYKSPGNEKFHLTYLTSFNIIAYCSSLQFHFPHSTTLVASRQCKFLPLYYQRLSILDQSLINLAPSTIQTIF
jgi:hypothetical protein